MIDKKEVGIRLRQFGKSKFGTLELLADSLNMSAQSLQSYLNGRSLPGAEIISKLKTLGCDTDWLLLNKDEPMADRVSEGPKNNETVKDKIIVSQAEEIQKLKEDMNELLKKINVLEIKSKEFIHAAGKIPD